MVDFPTPSQFAHVPLVGIPKSLSTKEIADLFADLGKLLRREKAATGLITALRKRLGEWRALLAEAKALLEIEEEGRGRLVGANDLIACIDHALASGDVVQVSVDPLPPGGEPDEPKGD